MALMPPVSAISGTIGPSLAASARLIARPTSVEPVKATPAMRGSATSAAPTLPSPVHEMQRARRHAGLMQQPHGLGRDQRRLLGGLGDHRVAGGERRRDLAEENRERKIPRADADEHAAPAIAQFVALAGRSRHRLRRERAPRLGGVIAAIIDRLAHFGDRSRRASCRLRPAAARSAGRARLRADRRRARAHRRGARPASPPRPQSRLAPPPSPRSRSPRRLRSPGRPVAPSIGEITGRCVPVCVDAVDQRRGLRVAAAPRARPRPAAQPARRGRRIRRRAS